jgi:hypothetical protein
MSQMDRGQRSREYRESLAYLRSHAADAAVEVSRHLLAEPGSFRKWQVSYLVGEFGDENAVGLLRTFIDEPVAPAQLSVAESHAVDLRYTEEVASRVQAVMSIARIASHRPQLRDQVVEALIASAQEVPLVKSTALFELQKLLGPEFQSLQGRFDPDDEKQFEPFMPPPQWQGLLSRRTQEHRRQELELREKRTPVCQAN